MKIQNKSKHSFQHSFLNSKMELEINELKAGEIKDINDSIDRVWLKTGDGVEYVSPEAVKKEQADLKAEIEKLKAENAKLKSGKRSNKSTKKSTKK